jgi:hypothetical protein
MVDNLTNAIVQLILNAQLVDLMDMKAMFLLALVCLHQFAQIALWEEF